jgi:hypothetical protein
MPVTLVIALLTALGAGLAIFIGARSSGRSRLTKLERTAVGLCVAGFAASSYQLWLDSRKAELSTHLKLAWEDEQDSPVQHARLSIIFPRGITTQKDISNHFSSIYFNLAPGSGKPVDIRASFIANDDAWFIQVGNEKPQRIKSVVYGVPLSVGHRHYCWWSESWEPPKATSFRQDDTEFLDRALCAVGLDIPVVQLPIRRLRDVSSLHTLSVILERDPGSMLCAGECTPIVSLMLSTATNRFDISPFQHGRLYPNLKARPKKIISATGVGTINRLQILFHERQGVSSREGQKLKMSVVDWATQRTDRRKVLGVFEIIPSIPPSLDTHEDFVSRFRNDSDSLVFDRWCGYVDDPEMCITSMVATSRPIKLERWLHSNWS